MSKRRGAQRGKKTASEFSSDEEVIRQSPRLSGKRQQTSKTASQSTYMGDVCKLDDEELAEELRNYGENPGPILDSTRGVYQKKLARLMAEKTKASDESRSRDVVDYGTDHMGEWSSHSSEGETDPEEAEKDEEEEEEEEEAGALEEPASVRLRSSSSSKSQRVVYRTYSTPTRHVESSYLLRKPKPSPTKAPAGEGVQQSAQKVSRSSKPRPSPPSRGAPPPPASSKTLHPRSPPPPPPSLSSLWSSLLSISLLLVMFAVTFLVYDHYTNPESSFFLQALTYLRELEILKKSDNQQ